MHPSGDEPYPNAILAAHRPVQLLGRGVVDELVDAVHVELARPRLFRGRVGWVRRCLGCSILKLQLERGGHFAGNQPTYLFSSSFSRASDERNPSEKAEIARQISRRRNLQLQKGMDFTHHERLCYAPALVSVHVSGMGCHKNQLGEG